MIEEKTEKPKCRVHGILLYLSVDEGYACIQCEQEDWNRQAELIVKGFKCPVCSRPIKVTSHDVDYVEFRCELVFDEKGNYAKPPCPHFRIQVCETCFRPSCVCEE